jgi:hypothetical protein
MKMVQIPLSSGAQFFNIALGHSYYTLKLAYRDAVYGGWFLDIQTLDGESLIEGIPLVCGVSRSTNIWGWVISMQWWAACTQKLQPMPTWDRTCSSIGRIPDERRKAMAQVFPACGR